MASVNKWIGIGNLGKDPEVRHMPNGDTVTNVSIACTDSYKDKVTGERKEVTEWVRVVFFRKLAEIAGQYLKKGSQVYIEGSLKTRKWQDKDGQDRYTTEIVADQMQMLGSRGQPDSEGSGAPEPQRESSAGNQGGAAQNPESSGGLGDFEDDIPF